MSFKVDWNLLETESMSQWTKELLTDALNSGKRPNILASNIEIKDLNFGHTPPVFEILEIGELEQDRFRGIFKISYDGDSHMTLHTKVQANPLKIYHDNLVELEHYVGGSSNFITPNFLVSNNEFSIPLDLKLSDIKINAIGIIVFSKTKGLTLVFRNDPLDSIKVSSTFDMVQVLANFLQKQIESQIRELFRETLPTVLHKLSLKYISLNNDFDANFLNKLHNIDKEINHDNHSNGENDVILFDLNNESNNYLVKNLQRNLKLFNSRETLNLNIPKFKKIIQRCNLDKYNKNLSPNLLTSLNLLNNDYKLDDYSNSNGIPINLLISKDDNNVQEMIKNISNIQSNNYYKNNVTNNDNKSSINVKPKRRTIKLSKKSDKEKNPSEKSSPLLISKSSSMNTLLKKKAGSEHLDTVDSEDNTLVDSDEIIYPRPIRPKSRINSTSVSTAGSMDHSLANSIDSMAPEPNGQYQEKDPHSHLYRKFSSSPLNSSITGVGIGNNYFNFTSKDPITELEESNKEFNDKINKLYQSRINEINEKYKIKIILHDHDAKLAGKPKSTTKVTAKPVAKPVTKSAMKSDVTNHNLSPPIANNKSDNFKLTNDTYLDFKTIKNRLNELRKIEDKSYFDMPPPYQV